MLIVVEAVWERQGGKTGSIHKLYVLLYFAMNLKLL